jgi:hypothetical protein
MVNFEISLNCLKAKLRFYNGDLISSGDSLPTITGYTKLIIRVTAIQRKKSEFVTLPLTRLIYD